MEYTNKSSIEGPTPESVVQKIASLKPKFRNKNDAVVFAIHVIMMENGFIFAGCGDKNDDSVTNTTVPAKWNASDDAYSFRYKLQDTTVLLKAVILEGQVLVHALVIGDKKMYNLTLTVDEFVNDVSLENYEKLYKNVETVMTLLTIEIISTLQESYPAKSKPTSSLLEEPRRQQHDPNRDYDYDPLRIPPRQPRPSPLADPSFGYPYPTPFGTGNSDLFPDISPGVPGGLFGGPGSGNLVGPNHPGFMPAFQDPSSRGRGRGQFPPGSRFDPFGPPGTGNRFGKPDNDEMPPPKGPGYDNMFM